jgi:hypothetical protein
LVKSHGIIYHALQMVVVAIDGAAHVITGRPYYFSEGGAALSESDEARTERQSRHSVQDAHAARRKCYDVV